MKKISLLFVLILSSIIFTGSIFNKTDIVFSTTPFNKSTNYKPQSIFHKGDKIYFSVYNEKGFKTRLIKVQVFKKESAKSEFWGYEYLYNRTCELEDKNTYSDYVKVYNTGYYIFRIFDYTNFQKPVITGIIKVVD